MEPASLSRPSRPKRVVTWLIAGVLTLGMLVYQGAIAFKLWTGYDAPVEVMKKALAAEFAAD